MHCPANSNKIVASVSCPISASKSLLASIEWSSYHSHTKKNPDKKKNIIAVLEIAVAVVVAPLLPLLVACRPSRSRPLCPWAVARTDESIVAVVAVLVTVVANVIVEVGSDSESAC